MSIIWVNFNRLQVPYNCIIRCICCLFIYRTLAFRDHLYKLHYTFMNFLKLWDHYFPTSLFLVLPLPQSHVTVFGIPLLASVMHVLQTILVQFAFYFPYVFPNVMSECLLSLFYAFLKLYYISKLLVISSYLSSKYNILLKWGQYRLS